MHRQTDSQLLRAYAEQRSEPAFAELVRRHVDLVYSAALRMVCDSHLAQDATQGVFLALAKNASRLVDRPVLSGWLHVTARNLAAQTVRTDVRRRAREQEAAAMNKLLSADPGASWEEIAPHLDAALGELAEADRDAVLLRYFERKSAGEMAQILGVSDDAAQKRVSRAVERLREFFAKQGITIGTSGLLAVVTANAVQAAPVGLAATICTAAALVGATLATAATATAAKAIAMTALQKTLVTAMVAVLAGVGLYEAYRASQLRDQVRTLQQRQAPLTAQIQQLQSERDDAAIKLASLQDATEQQRLRKEHLELLSLRGRVSQLANQLRRQNANPSTDASSNTTTDPAETDSILFSVSLTNRLESGRTLVLGGWSRDGMRGYLLLTPAIREGDTSSDPERPTVQSQMVGAPESFWTQIGWGIAKSEMRRSSLAGVLTRNQLEILLRALKETKGAEISNTSTPTGRDGERMQFGFSMADDNQSGVLMGIDVYPRIATDGRSVDLEIRPSAVSTNTPIHPWLDAPGQTTSPSAN